MMTSKCWVMDGGWDSWNSDDVAIEARPCEAGHGYYETLTAAGRAAIIDIRRSPMTRRHSLAFALLGGISVLGAMAGPARADYPDKPITWVLCFPAGGGT